MRLIDADKYAFPGDLIHEPTIDAEPVRHGHWIHLGSNSSGELYMCSVCHGCRNPSNMQVYYGRVEIAPPFCEMCGAKMDEEANT